MMLQDCGARLGTCHLLMPISWLDKVYSILQRPFDRKDGGREYKKERKPTGGTLGSNSVISYRQGKIHPSIKAVRCYTHLINTPRIHTPTFFYRVNVVFLLPSKNKSTADATPSDLLLFSFSSSTSRPVFLDRFVTENITRRYQTLCM